VSTKVSPDPKLLTFNYRCLKFMVDETQAYFDALRNLINSFDDLASPDLSKDEVKTMFSALLLSHLKNLGDFFGGQVLKKTDKKSKRMQLERIDENSLNIVLKLLGPSDLHSLSFLSSFWSSRCDRLLEREVTFEPDKTFFLGIRKSGIWHFPTDWDENCSYNNTETVNLEVCCSNHCSGIPNQLLKVSGVKKFTAKFSEVECSTYASMIYLSHRFLQRNCDTLETVSLTLPMQHVQQFHLGHVTFANLKEFSISFPSIEDEDNAVLTLPNSPNLQSLSMECSTQFGVFTVGSIPSTTVARLKALNAQG
jgi:hypothetical protein